METYRRITLASLFVTIRDFDKFAASSSIIILDFDVITKKFKVIKRIEVPRGEYTLDNAVNMIIEVNQIYKPSWIYVDRGYGKKNCRLIKILLDLLDYQWAKSVKILKC